MDKKLSTLSEDRKKYLYENRNYNIKVKTTQISLLFSFFFLWELLAKIGLIDDFITSCPSRIIKVFFNFKQNHILSHLKVTVYETLIGLSIGIILGIILTIVLWWSKFFSKVCEPYLVILNSLPKIALGPVIIIWVGAGTKAIIITTVAISLMVTTLELLNGFNSTDKNLIKMAKTFKASKFQILCKIVIPSNISTLFNSLKINIGLTLVGVIAGEYLVSKAGLGYLIIYGGQIFQMDIVMSSVILLAIFATILYQIAVFIEIAVINKFFNNRLTL
ncbi:MAG: ABC transporter permease [Firmicutes bacterium]|nr:ABC transporter permease [Bacillota bacterium]